jgi:hypothetical protein
MSDDVKWPQGPTPLMGRRCGGCWYQRAGGREKVTADVAVATKEALSRELYVPCREHPGAVCAGFYELFSTASLRMVHMIWGFMMVDPPTREEARR